MNRLYTSLKLLIALALASVTGLGGTLLLLNTDLAIETVHIGPWIARIPVGRGVANPYIRAGLARSGAVPLAATEAIIFTAGRDSEGRQLRHNCDYELRSGRIEARWWTLTLESDGTEPQTGTQAGKSADGWQHRSFNSANILRTKDGDFTIAISPQAVPGNWLFSKEAGAPSLTLRIYDTGLYTNGGLPEAALPTIVRGACT